MIRCLIYIPLCFYFIFLLHVGQRALFFIYIPLCFYFILKRLCMKKTFEGIYIPLCFYFISPRHVRGEEGGAYLHSTMLLLYLPLIPAQAFSFSIYIPLCFYFIVEDIIRKHLNDGIYIPLCFYFIVFKTPDRCKKEEFTFHYASTLSGVTYY